MEETKHVGKVTDNIIKAVKEENIVSEPDVIKVKSVSLRNQLKTCGSAIMNFDKDGIAIVNRLHLHDVKVFCRSKMGSCWIIDEKKPKKKEPSVTISKPVKEEPVAKSPKKKDGEASLIKQMISEEIKKTEDEIKQEAQKKWKIRAEKDLPYLTMRDISKILSYYNIKNRVRLSKNKQKSVEYILKHQLDYRKALAFEKK
jgi:hypothetical protein